MSYTPKPGDSVKATLGDNVLYGEVEKVGLPDLPDWKRLDVDGGVFVIEVGPEWTFEPWVKPVTFKLLTVVRLAVDAPSVVFTVEPYWTDADRQPFDTPVTMYRYGENEWNAINGLVDLSDAGVARALAAGKAEILFEGVDE